MESFRVEDIQEAIAPHLSLLSSIICYTHYRHHYPPLTHRYSHHFTSSKRPHSLSHAIMAQLRSFSSASDTEADYSYPTPKHLAGSDTETADEGYKSIGVNASSTAKAPVKASAEPKGARHADEDWN